LDFTVMGPAVNRTARIEALTRPLRQDVLMSADFVRNIDVTARSLGAHAMKGIAEPQEVFAPADDGA
jgi:adenylate cyclase